MITHYPTKILLAIDGSQEAKGAAAQAIELCDKTGSELHLIHVGLISEWVHPDTLSQRQFEQLKTDAQKRLDKEVKMVEELGGKIAGAHLRMGRVDGEVIRLSEELKCGLIVIGSRGQGTISRILLGNDAESIVRHAPCPVLVARRLD